MHDIKWTSTGHKNLGNALIRASDAFPEYRGTWGQSTLIPVYSHPTNTTPVLLSTQLIMIYRFGMLEWFQFLLLET